MLGLFARILGVVGMLGTVQVVLINLEPQPVLSVIFGMMLGVFIVFEGRGDNLSE